MKRFIFIISLALIILSNSYGQTLSSYSVLNPDTANVDCFFPQSLGSMLRPSLHVHYLQSISGRDTIRTPHFFFRLNIYEDNLPMSDDWPLLYHGDYAFGGCVSEAGDTVLVCMNNDLTVRFVFPVNTVSALPFENGISVCRFSPWRALHAAESEYGAVARDGTVLFEPNHKAIAISKNKAIAVDKRDGGHCSTQWNEYSIVAKNNTGVTEESFVFYYPKKYDVDILDNANFFWNDIDNKDTNDFGNDIWNYDIVLDIYSAFVNMVQLDFLAAYNHLLKARDSDDPLIRKCARKNLRTLRRLFR